MEATANSRASLATSSRPPSKPDLLVRQVACGVGRPDVTGDGLGSHVKMLLVMGGVALVAAASWFAVCFLRAGGKN